MSTPLATHQDSIVKTVTPRDPSSPTPITMTQSAINKIRELIEDEGNPELSLRVFITGGGCSGFQYGFTFDETVQADDFVIQPEEKKPSATVVRLLVDPMSAQYLMGAVIDYTEDLTGAQFIIRNPNAKTTCGCGSSFSADVPDDESSSEE